MPADSTLSKEAAPNDKIQPVENLLTFWRSGTFSQSATSTQKIALHLHHDFLTFLAIAQRLKIDFLPITWQPAMDRVGQGATAEIWQSLINLQTNFTFKRFKRSLNESSIFQALISEIMILGDASIRNHENIIRLEGICWDIPTGENEVRPVLVFEKSQHGDLEQFLQSISGRTIDSMSRLKLCVDVGLAILIMHSNSIIHGDIKPRNVLVFREELDKVVARVTDFGYSTHFASENLIYMPRSVPWDAPEYHHRGFSVYQAMKMDIYSFGMLCLWLIFEKKLSEPIPPKILGERRSYTVFSLSPVEHEGLNLLWDLKSEDLLPKLASYLIATNADLDDTQKDDLQIFFNSSLVKDPERRSSSLRKLLPLIDPGVKIPGILPLAKQEAASFHEDFEIVPSLRQFYSADFRLRSYITSCLDKRLLGSIEKSCRDETCCQKTAFQLAFCYKLGFGIQQDDEKSQVLLRKSLKQNKELEDEVELLRHAWSRYYFQQENINNLDTWGHIRQFDYGQNYCRHQILDIAKREYKREIADIESVLGDKHSIVSVLRSTLASIFRYQGRWAEAEELDAKLLEIRKKRSEADYLDIASVTHNLAVDFLNQGKHEAAEMMNYQVLESTRKAQGVEHPDTLGSMNNLASTLYSRGKFKEAEEMHRLVLEGYVKVLGKKHPETLASMNNLALVLQSQGKQAAAETMYRQALELCEGILGNEHPDALATMNNLGLALYQQDKNEEAREIHQQVLESREKVLGKEHASTLSTVSNLALVLDRQGHYEAAEKLYQRAFSGFEKVLGAEHPDTLHTMTKVASSLGKQCKYQEAEEIHHRAVDRHEEVLGKRHPYTIMAISELGLILLEQGKTAASDAIFQRAFEQGRGYGR